MTRTSHSSLLFNKGGLPSLPISRPKSGGLRPTQLNQLQCSIACGQSNERLPRLRYDSRKLELQEAHRAARISTRPKGPPRGLLEPGLGAKCVVRSCVKFWEVPGVRGPLFSSFFLSSPSLKGGPQGTFDTCTNGFRIGPSKTLKHSKGSLRCGLMVPTPETPTPRPRPSAW